MRVLLINSYYAPNVIGGSERSVQTLAETLHQRGHEVMVGCLAIDQEERQDTINGVEVHYLADRNLGRATADPRRSSLDRMLWHFSGEFLAGCTAAVRRLLRDHRPDIVHTNALGGFSCGALWKAAREQGVPVVHTLRDYHLMCARGVMFRRGRTCASPCWGCGLVAGRRRLATAKVDAVVGISDFILQRHLQSGYFLDCSSREVIHNACHPPAAVREAGAGRPAGLLRVGYLGRLHPTKGIEALLLAAGRVAGLQLEVAGTGPEDYVRHLHGTPWGPHVYFSGYQDYAAFFRRIDLLVVPSQWAEPLGRVIIESYAQGVPVLAAARGGIPEIVEEGRTGWLFDPDERDVLEARLRALVDDPAVLERLREGCLRAAQPFHPERVAAAYERTYAAARKAAV